MQSKAGSQLPVVKILSYINCKYVSTQSKVMRTGSLHTPETFPLQSPESVGLQAVCNDADGTGAHIELEEIADVRVEVEGRIDWISEEVLIEVNDHKEDVL